MAGGTGTRLWPISRQATPKQFQRLIGEKTLLQQTFDRINKVLPSEQIWVMTGEQYATLAADQLPEIKPEHIITEPSARNTAAATGLALLKVLEEDPEAVLFGLLPADHYINDEAMFATVVEEALGFLEANPKKVITIGIRPTGANTGYGYIKTGAKLATLNAHVIETVEAFLEKPDQVTAERFFQSGQYLWNGGYYLFNGQAMLGYYQELAPEILDGLKNYQKNPSKELYGQIPKAPIDKAIVEKLANLAVIPVEMGWSDVGDWAALHQILAAHHQTSEVAVGDHIGKGNTNSLVIGTNKLVVTVGLKDVMVIDTDGAILVCHKDSVQEVKKIVEQLEQQGRSELL